MATSSNWIRIQFGGDGYNGPREARLTARSDLVYKPNIMVNRGALLLGLLGLLLTGAGEGLGGRR